jgi:hypothetical protein
VTDSVSEELKADERERSLQAIGDVIEYWLKWVTRERDDEGLETTPDTHIMLANENAPPYWPSVGQLKRWLEVLRATPPVSGDMVERVARAGAPASWLKYDELKRDGLPIPNWLCDIVAATLGTARAALTTSPEPPKGAPE